MNKIKTNEIKNKLDDTKRWEEKIKPKHFKYQTNIYILYILYIYKYIYIRIFQQCQTYTGKRVKVL